MRGSISLRKASMNMSRFFSDSPRVTVRLVPLGKSETPEEASGGGGGGGGEQEEDGEEAARRSEMVSLLRA